MLTTFNHGPNKTGTVPTEIEPVIRTTTTEIEKRSGMAGGLGVARVDVVNDIGVISRFWVSVTVGKDGKPTVTVTTKPDAEKKTQRVAKVKGSFNIVEPR